MASKKEPSEEKPISAGEIVTRLQALAEKDSDTVVLFASRCALRAFPLLAAERSFAYWLSSKRVRHLFSIWSATLVASLGPSRPNQHLNPFIADPAAAAADVDADADAAAAAAAAYAAAAAAYAAAADAAYTAAAAAAAYAADAANAAAAAFHFNKNRDFDLRVLEQRGVAGLVNAPLWSNEVTLNLKYLRIVQQDLPYALNQLMAEEPKKTEIEIQLLENIHPLYMRIYEGSTTQDEIEKEVEKLSHYFDSVDQKGDAEPAMDSADANELLDDSVAEPKTKVTEEEEKEQQKEQGQETRGDEITLPQKDLDRDAPSHHNSHQASTVDHLNRERLVDTLATILAAPNNHHHQTIGLLGHWGIGKSTVINLLKERLLKDHQEQPFLFAEFNAWEYEHTDNVQAGIAQEMIKALSSPEEGYIAPEKNILKKIKQKLAFFLGNTIWVLFKRPFFICRFAIAMQGWRIVGLLFAILISVSPLFFSDVIKPFLVNIPGGDEGVPQLLWIGGFLLYFYKQLKPIFAGPMAKELFTYLKLPDYGEHLGTIPVMRKHIKIMSEIRLNQANKTKKRLLYVVDDLDRCSPDGIVKVLEAVRLVLDLEQVMVIIAVDQRIALSALALHYEKLAKYHSTRNPKNIARDYLAKMIHLPITLSEPDTDSVGAYLDKLWEQTHDEEPKDNDSKENSIQEGQGAPPTLANNQNPESTPEENLLGSADNESGRASLDAPLTSKTELDSKQENQNQSEEAPIGNQELDEDQESDLPDVSDDNTQAKPKPLVGMSTQQQKAFKYWLDHFGLANPRQVKRLDNSYNVIRQFYDEDKTLPESKTDEDTKAYLKHYPLLVTLFALEYINNNDDIANRKKIKDILLGRATNTGEDLKVTDAVVTLINQILKDNTIHLVNAVEPFVLPAVEDEDIEEENSFAKIKAIRQKLDDVRSEADS